MCVCVAVCVQMTLCDPMDYSLPGSSVPGISQARTLGVPFSTLGDLPDPGIKPRSLTSAALAGRFFLSQALPGKTHLREIETADSIK